MTLLAGFDAYRNEPRCDGNTMTGREEVTTNYACQTPKCLFSYVARFRGAWVYECGAGHVAAGTWRP